MHIKILEEKIRTLLLNSYWEGWQDCSSLTSTPEIFSKKEYLEAHKSKIDKLIEELKIYEVKNKKTE